MIRGALILSALVASGFIYGFVLSPEGQQTVIEWVAALCLGALFVWFVYYAMRRT